MDNQFLDHANIAALKQMFRTSTREELTTSKQLKLAEQEIPRFPPLSTLSVFISVELLDLRRCALTEFPGALIAKGLPALQTVDLSYNRLQGVEGVLPLGNLKKLRDLRLESNPIPYVSERVVLLQRLLYPEKLVHLKMKRIYGGMHRNTSLSTLFTPRRKPLSLCQLLSSRPKPAPVPRVGTFPMLEILCGGRITVEELESARPYPVEDIFSSPQHPRQHAAVRLDPLPRHPQLKSRYPCIIRNPRVEPPPRYIKVEAVVLSGATDNPRVKELTGRGDSSECGSFLEEEDLPQNSESEGEVDTYENASCAKDLRLTEAHFLPSVKSSAKLGGTYSPHSEITSSCIY